MEVVASLSQVRTAAAQRGLFTYKSVPVIFEPPCITESMKIVYQLSINLRGRGFLGKVIQKTQPDATMIY